MFQLIIVSPALTARFPTEVMTATRRTNQFDPDTLTFTGISQAERQPISDRTRSMNEEDSRASAALIEVV